jgi:VanZ family protein
VAATTILGMCAIAFVAVFALLTFLAITMHFITSLFPTRGTSVDAAIVAAISGAVASVLPGARVTHIEEER